MKVLKFHFFVSFIFLFSVMLVQAESKFPMPTFGNCRVSGIAGKVDDAVCNLREFVRTVENFNAEIKQEIKEKRAGLVKYDALYYAGPGRGKTTVFKQIAKEMAPYATVKFFRASELINTPDAQKFVKELYKEAEELVEKTGRPVVIIVDNVELFSKVKEERDYHDPGERFPFDGVNYKASRVVAPIGTEITNHEYNPYIITILIADVERITQIFEPLVSHFFHGDREWLDPYRQDRAEIITHYAEQHGNSIPSWMISFMAYISEGATGKEIEDVFNTHNGTISKSYHLFRRGDDVIHGIKVISGLLLTYLGYRYGMKYYKNRQNHDNDSHN